MAFNPAPRMNKDNPTRKDSRTQRGFITTPPEVRPHSSCRRFSCSDYRLPKSAVQVDGDCHIVARTTGQNPMPNKTTPWTMITLLLLSVAGQAQPQTASDWLSFGHDQRRRGKNTGEAAGRRARQGVPDLPQILGLCLPAEALT
jgi:hypothetical protein